MMPVVASDDSCTKVIRENKKRTLSACDQTSINDVSNEAPLALGSAKME